MKAIRHDTVIITGGTKGLGRELSRAFGQAGYFVVALYRADEAAAEKWRAEMGAGGIAGLAVCHDVCGAEIELERWMRPEIQQADCLTLINNACASFIPRPFHLLDWEDFGAGMDVAIKGSWRMSRSALRPMMRKGCGNIVNVLSAAVHELPPKGFAAYATAKHALLGLTRALASEYHAKGIRVFSVSPGFMDTALTQAWEPRLREAVLAGGVPVNHPAVVAGNILRLVESREIAGQGEDHAV